MDEINVCFMSRKRVKRLLTAVDLVKENTTGVNYKISLLFDDDQESFEQCKSLGYNCYLYSPQKECVKMTNNCFKLTKELGLDYFVFLNDDMEVHKDWLKNAFKDFVSTFPDKKGLVSFNILPKGGDTLCVAGLTTVTFIESCLNGVFFDEVFIHNEGDGDFTYRVMFLNKFKWSPSSQICHNHYLNNASLLDETYSASHRFFGADLFQRKKIFQDRGWTDQVLKKLLLDITTKEIKNES
jgi:hypothetical protein